MGVEGSAAPAGRPRASAPRVAAGTIYCEVCGEETPHRVLRIDLHARPEAPSGTARCSRCRWTHAFSTEPARVVEVDQILSDGPASSRARLRVPAGSWVIVGERVPGSEEAFRILRIDRRDGRRAERAPSEEVATVWTVRDQGAVVPVSLVEGRVTRAARLVLEPSTPLAVGSSIVVERTEVTIVGLRARGKTWRRPGDVFSAGEVGRLYVRRSAMPPAGSRGWSRARGSPSSRESSTSSAGRSRSSPGVIRPRKLPRARTADGGATDHRSSPW
jgi:uncharacterized Zn finger protein